MSATAGATELGFGKEIDAHVQQVTAALGAITQTANNPFSNKGPGGKFMYYTKGAQTMEPGYVVITSAHPTQVMWNVRRGMIPLFQFGEFTDAEVGWSFLREPHRRILEMGGAALYPEAQIVENNWDLTPPIKGLKWPQLEGKTIERRKCSYCTKMFLTLEHLQAHESIRHATTSQQTSLARHLADANAVTTEAIMESVKALHAQNVGGSAQIAEALTMIATLLAKQTAAAEAPVPAPVPAPAAVAPTKGTKVAD